MDAVASVITSRNLPFLSDGEEDEQDVEITTSACQTVRARKWHQEAQLAGDAEGMDTQSQLISTCTETEGYVQQISTQ